MRTRFVFLAGIVTLMISSCGGGETPATAPAQKQTDSVVQIPPLVRPPVPEFDPVFEEIEVDAEKGGEFLVKNSKGSVIRVPAGVLVDSLRNPVSGKVTLRYREFKDAADIYCAGIPMDYDAAGMIKRFETAGMFELRAFQGETEVFVDSGETVEVRFAGDIAGGDYHFFFLDENGTRNWHYVGDQGGMANPEKEKIRKKKKQKVLQIPLGDGYFAFNYMAALDVMMNDDYTQINRNRNSPQTKTRISDYGLTWSNIYNYQSITYEGKTYLASMLVWKNLSGTPFPNWVGKADSELKQLHGNVYELSLTDRSGNSFKVKIEAFMSLKSLFAFSAQQWKSNYEQTMRKVKEDEKRLSAMAEVYRTMEINEFGIYNYDRFMNDENRVSVKAEFKFDRDPGILQNQEICYVSGSGRTVVKYPFDKWNNIILVPDSGAKLFALLPGNYIALFSSDKYAKLNLDQLRALPSPSMVFEMVTVGQFNGAEDLRKILLGEKLPS